MDKLNAPIKKGDIVGKAVVINEDGVVVSEISLISEEDNLKQSMLDVLRKISYKW
ncbi:MAG: hypothetical protein IJT25_03060 [Clostridia bacterium]|nr:hypothetical protein [Clostridia bacterium]